MIADNRDGGERAIAAPSRFRAPGSHPGAIVAPAIKLCLLVVVNGDEDDVHTLYQKDTHKGIILSTALKLPLAKGKNTIAVGGLYNGKDIRGADLDKIVVYPPEPRQPPKC